MGPKGIGKYREQKVAEIDKSGIPPKEKRTSLKYYAEQNGMTWQELTEFNWGTTNIRVINHKLYNEIGCRLPTADGRSYMFDGHETDDDRKGTGIIYIPEKTSPKECSANQTHEIEGRVLNSVPWIRFIIENEFNEPVPNVNVTIILQDKITRLSAKSNQNGLVEIIDKKFKPGNTYTIELDWKDVDKNRSKS